MTTLGRAREVLKDLADDATAEAMRLEGSFSVDQREHLARLSWNVATLARILDHHMGGDYPPDLPTTSPKATP